MGTLRNKLSTGHTRYNVYFSQMILGLGVSVVLLLAHFVTSGICCHYFFLPTRFSVWEQMLCTLTVLTGTAVYTSLLTALALIMNHLSHTVAVSFLSVLILMQQCSRIHNSLSESRLVAGEYIETSDRAYYELVVNPYYPSGLKRKFLAFLQDMLPHGQLMQIMESDLSSAWCWPILSMVLTAGIMTVGYWIFQRKNIR